MFTNNDTLKPIDEFLGRSRGERFLPMLIKVKNMSGLLSLIMVLVFLPLAFLGLISLAVMMEIVYPLLLVVNGIFLLSLLIWMALKCYHAFLSMICLITGTGFLAPVIWGFHPILFSTGIVLLWSLCFVFIAKSKPAMARQVNAGAKSGNVVADAGLISKGSTATQESER